MMLDFRTKTFLLAAFFLGSLVISCNSEQQKAEEKSIETKKEARKKDWAIVIHGGAGTILKENMTPEKETAYFDKLNEVLLLGKEILSSGGSSLDAVEQCIQLMEASPLFNAGKGSVFTHEGKNEMDASIMDGSDLDAGAVAGVSTIKSPISAARQVMENSPHVMLSREGAEEFAESMGEEIVDPSYFFTQDRFETLERVKEKEKAKKEANPDEKYGTVGVVCLDKNGNLAAGTSTGGMTNKRWGRIGDSPIIGAGTYANNASCGVSATGHGEFFIRLAVAHEINALVLYKEMSIKEAAEEVVMKRLVEIGALGGVIVLDKNGDHSMVFNTPGMYRGYLNSEGKEEIKIYSEDIP